MCTFITFQSVHRSTVYIYTSRRRAKCCLVATLYINSWFCIRYICQSMLYRFQGDCPEHDDVTYGIVLVPRKVCPACRKCQSRRAHSEVVCKIGHVSIGNENKYAMLIEASALNSKSVEANPSQHVIGHLNKTPLKLFLKSLPQMTEL